MIYDFNDSPGWVAAVARERQIREAAYLGLPYPIAGGALLLSPLTLRQQMVLYASRNPIVSGGPIRQVDAVAFLWALQPEYAPTNTAGREAFFARLETAALPWRTVVGDLRDFFEISTLDAPKPKTKRSGGLAPAVSGASIYVERFATAFGWTRDYVLDSPVVCLNQEGRCMRMKEKNCGISGGRYSIAEERKWVNEMRRRKAEETAAPATA